METVIITLRAKDFEKDYELPCTIPLSELYPRLIVALQETSSMRFGNYSGVVLEQKGAGMLDLNASLLDYGVCDGLYLDIVEKRKDDDGFRGK